MLFSSGRSSWSFSEALRRLLILLSPLTFEQSLWRSSPCRPESHDPGILPTTLVCLGEGISYMVARCFLRLVDLINSGLDTFSGFMNSLKGFHPNRWEFSSSSDWKEERILFLDFEEAPLLKQQIDGTFASRQCTWDPCVTCVCVWRSFFSLAEGQKVPYGMEMSPQGASPTSPLNVVDNIFTLATCQSSQIRAALCTPAPEFQSCPRQSARMYSTDRATVDNIICVHLHTCPSSTPQTGGWVAHRWWCHSLHHCAWEQEALPIFLSVSWRSRTFPHLLLFLFGFFHQPHQNLYFTFFYMPICKLTNYLGEQQLAEIVQLCFFSLRNPEVLINDKREQIPHYNYS